MSWKLIKEGDRVQINAFTHKGQKGYVRYKGEVEGLVGEMLGIELDEPNGKNDGSHEGNRYFECPEGHGIFFRSAQVKAVADTSASDSKGSSIKKPAGGLKKPATGGLKKPTKTESKDESKEEEEDGSKSSRASTKSKVGTGLKGPSTKATGLKKPGDGDESSRASKLSKVKAGSRLGAPKAGLKKPDSSLKKPEGTKTLAQKKEEIRNKVKAKKAGEETKKTGVKKFTKPTKAGESSLKPTKKPSKASSKADDLDEAEEAKLEASMLSSKSSQSKKSDTAKPKIGGGLKKPAGAAKSGIGGLKKPGESKLGLKKPAGSKLGGTTKKPAAKPSDKPTTGTVKKPSAEKSEEADKSEKAQEKDEEEVEDVSCPESDNEEEANKKLEKLEKMEDNDDEQDKNEDDQEDDEGKEEEPTEEVQEQPKKVLKRPDPAKSEGPSGSNLKMLQQTKVELAKRETQIKDLQEELKEVYEKLKNSDDVHLAEMEIQKLELEQRIAQRDKELEEKTNSIKTLNIKLQNAEANQKSAEDVSMSKQQLEELKEKEDKFKTELEQKEKIIEELNQEVDKYSTELQTKDQQIEELKIDIETLEVEKTIAVEEKEIMEEEMKQQEQERLKAMESSMTDDELKYQNEKLRIAIRKLTNDLEVERVDWDKQREEYEEQLTRIPELEEKLADLDLLLEAVEERDNEIEAMKETVEEATEFQQMVEELTEELVEKEELIEELEAKVAEMDEVQAVQEEINAGQEAYEKELQGEIAKKDIQIQDLENDIQILEEALLEQDDKETKHKERIGELNKEVEILKEQLSSAYDDNTKNKISELIEKQKKLSNQLREASRKEIGGSLAEINLGISNTLADLYNSFVPEKLLAEGYISNFNKVRLLIFVKNKAHLTFIELCRKKFIEGSDFAYGEGEGESYETFKYMCTLGHNCIRCLNECQKILHGLTFMSLEDYKQIADSSFWQNFAMANSFLDNMIKMIREDTLTTKVSQSTFEETLDEFEKFYQDSIRTSVNETITKSTGKEFDIETAPKNLVKEQVLKCGLAVLALGFYTRLKDYYQKKETDKSLQDKCTYVFWKMIDSLKAVDEIDQDDHGQEFFKSNINGLKRIQDKYEFVQKFWEEDSMAPDQDTSQTDISEETKAEDQESPSKESSRSSKISYDWFAWIDSVDREILNIMSEKNMQELREKVKQENPSPFLKKINRGPWVTLAEQVKESMAKSDALRDENEKMTQKIKDQNIAYAKLKKLNDDMEVIKDTFERKIAALELETQKLTPLMSDKKRLEEKLTFIQEEAAQKDKIISTQKEKIDKLLVEKEEIEKSASASSKSRKSMAGQKRGSTKKDMLGTLLKLGGAKRESRVESVIDEDAAERIYELEEENVKLKRSDLFKRISKLNQESSQFNKFLSGAVGNSENESEKRNLTLKKVRLTDEEQAEVQGSVSEITSIKSDLRLKMCNVKVFKLGDKGEETKSGKDYLKENAQNKQTNLRNLNSVKTNLKKINRYMFGGEPEGEFSTKFRNFDKSGITEKSEQANNWEVLGRVKIKPPSDSQNQGESKVEKIYLDEFAAHRVLRALPILPSKDVMVTL